eukprot:scaffold9677_cov121-Skeletonema_dohrnii-CCMP3373.AAC.16
MRDACECHEHGMVLFILCDNNGDGAEKRSLRIFGAQMQYPKYGDLRLMYSPRNRIYPLHGNEYVVSEWMRVERPPTAFGNTYGGSQPPAKNN